MTAQFEQTQRFEKLIKEKSLKEDRRRMRVRSKNKAEDADPKDNDDEEPGSKRHGEPAEAPVECENMNLKCTLRRRHCR